MGLKPAQGELNAALMPLFSHIDGVFLIHDDLIIATENYEQHLKAMEAVLDVIESNNLTLNPKKCIFAEKEI